MSLPFFGSLIATILSIHGLLYHPVFPTIPQAFSSEFTDTAITLSVPTIRHTLVPEVSAEAMIVVDEKSTEVLASKNADLRLFPASTTKMMTALLVLEEMPLEKIASVSAGIARDGSGMDLVVGEKITVRNLLEGLLVNSANDAADQLSLLYPGGRTAFVARMNERARELGLKHTIYTNAIGYSDPGHVTTVHDLALLAREAMKHDLFRELVQKRKETVRSVDGLFTHSLESTNELLGKYEGMEGVKTGWTEEAGECFVAQATRGNQTYISVVLRSADRFADTRKLLDWAFMSFRTDSKELQEW